MWRHAARSLSIVRAGCINNQWEESAANRHNNAIVTSVRATGVRWTVWLTRIICILVEFMVEREVGVRTDVRLRVVVTPAVVCPQEGSSLRTQKSCHNGRFLAFFPAWHRLSPIRPCFQQVAR